MASPIRENYSAESGDYKRCRTCTDFQTWAQMQRKTYNTAALDCIEQQSPELYFMLQKTDSVNLGTPSREDCPLDSSQLGRSTWGLLHTMAAYYPELPTSQQEDDVRNFFSTLSRLYPCSYCAEDFQKEIKASPPATKSQEELSQWLCRMHNNVNVKLGKPLFDCSRVNERWRDGWKDGSCD